jgi:hypothetical protein
MPEPTRINRGLINQMLEKYARKVDESLLLDFADILGENPKLEMNSRVIIEIRGQPGDSNPCTFPLDSIGRREMELTYNQVVGLLPYSSFTYFRKAPQKPASKELQEP